eukprot:6499126-Karenia_brevis.AAC.1
MDLLPTLLILYLVSPLVPPGGHTGLHVAQALLNRTLPSHIRTPLGLQPLLLFMDMSLHLPGLN